MINTPDNKDFIQHYFAHYLNDKGTLKPL